MSTTEDDQSKAPAEVEPQTRQKHPCVLCQQRKVRCDRNEPCQNCKKARVECIPASSMPPKKRKKRFPEAELLARLRKYEAHLRNYGADIDAINREEMPPKNPVELKPQPAPFEFERALCHKTIAIRSALKHVPSNLWNGMNDEFRAAEEILEGSSDEEDLESPITKTYDSISADTGDFLFPAQAPESLTDLHPPPTHIFRLWQTFLDNVNPIVKIFHAPTVQQQILDASADLGRVPRRTEVLMFGIYATAILSLSEAEVKAIFNEEKPTMLKRYQSACQQALLRAGFLRSSDLTVLQGFVLYLISCLNFAIDPRVLFCLTGIAMRIGQRMGLAADGTMYGLPPFETEMRRRLWWQMLIIDNRIGEISGAGPSLHMHMWTTRLPSNVNDTSLFPDMTDPPIEHPGATEMMFVLQKYEFIQFRHHYSRTYDVSDSKHPSIDAFEAMLENKYLKYCDTQVPMHHISLIMAKSAMCRLRMGPRHPSLLTRPEKELSEEEKESLFIWGVSMLEYHEMMLSAKNLTRFWWHINTNSPFPGQIYILCALRNRTTGELADRAWRALAASYARRYGGENFHKHMMRDKKKSSAMHLAWANLTLKAWEAREAAIPSIPVPEAIMKMRAELAESRSSKSGTDSSVSPPAVGDMPGGHQLDNPFPWLNQQPMDGQVFDQGAMMMPDPSAMDWQFWNGFVQPAPMSFDASMQPGFYQS